MTVIPNTQPVALCVPDPDYKGREPFGYLNGAPKHHEFRIVAWEVASDGKRLDLFAVCEKSNSAVSYRELQALYPELDFSEARILALPKSHR